MFRREYRSRHPRTAVTVQTEKGQPNLEPSRSLRRMLALVFAAFAVWFLGSRGGIAEVTPAPSEPYHVGVWFFTLWNGATRGMQVQNAEKLYKRPDVWAGVRDYAEGHGALPLRGDFNERIPLLGFYDEMSSETVDAEILMAASEGIEFLALYWYIDASTGNVFDISAPVPLFFKSPYIDRIKIALAIIVLGSPDQKLPMDAWKQRVVPQLMEYVQHPSYWRLNDRPVIIDFQTPFAGPEERREAYVYLRTEAARVTSRNPEIVSMLDRRATPGDIRFRLKNSRPDAFTCFTFGPTRSNELYPQLMEETKIGLRSFLTEIRLAGDAGFIPCGSIGIDARPWFGIGWTGYQGRTDPEARPYTNAPTPAEFGAHLKDLKDLVDAAPDATRRSALIYAWNEWGEAAAAIEPSRAWGYAYGDVLRQTFGLIPRSGRPALP
jgi:hypothetical protein